MLRSIVRLVLGWTRDVYLRNYLALISLRKFCLRIRGPEIVITAIELIRQWAS